METYCAEDATDFNPEVHARVLRKVDWHLLPLVTLLYLLSFLDRSNIGNAKIAGLETDLNLVGLRYNTAAAIFFVTYCLGQVPSNITLKFVRPSRWIPGIMVAWGFVMTLMCLVKTYPQLLVARLCLGFAEAGLVPGVLYYISLWYPRTERAKRIAIFMSAGTLSGAFGGILAYGIEKMNGIGGLRGWQWIFCLEGIATVLMALVSALVMYDYPETATFLTKEERSYIIGLMKADSQGLATNFDFQFVLQALGDYKTYLQWGVLFGCAVPAYAAALFTPTIVKELGFSAANAQLLSIPPFVAGCAMTVLFGIYSDKRQIRGPYVVVAGFIGLIGFIVLYTQTKPGVALVGVVLAVMGINAPIPVALAWTSANAGGDVKRATALAIVTGLTNTAGIFASFIFFDPPRFHVGLGICMGVLGSTMLLSLFMMWDYNRINKQKERKCNEHGITEERKDEFRENGDDSPLFRYGL